MIIRLKGLDYQVRPTLLQRNPNIQTVWKTNELLTGRGVQQNQAQGGTASGCDWLEPERKEKKGGATFINICLVVSAVASQQQGPQFNLTIRPGLSVRQPEPEVCLSNSNNGNMQSVGSDSPLETASGGNWRNCSFYFS